MSNLLPSPSTDECAAAAIAAPVFEPLPDHTAQVGSLTVHRVLPVRGRRLIGPWCFFDRYGPLSFTDGKPMDVAQHPHIGLQTVTWLLEGEIIHHDSLGSECLVRPGQLILMTSGRGIVHTEDTPPDNSGKLNGVQLWVALPDQPRTMPPQYRCTPKLTPLEVPGGLVTNFYGDDAHTPSLGAELIVHPGTANLPLDPHFEHGIMLCDGDASLDTVELTRDTLYYLGTHRGELTVKSRQGAKLLLIGGTPFGEKILMWWNFVARTPEEIAVARQAWEAHEFFPDVPQYPGPRLTAPPLTGRPK